MSDPTFDKTKTPSIAHDREAQYDDAKEQRTVSAAHEANQLAEAKRAIAARANLDQVPTLIGNLVEKNAYELDPILQDLAKVASGDIVFRAAVAAKKDEVQSLLLAFTAKTRPSAPIVRSTLERIDASDMHLLEAHVEQMFPSPRPPFLEVFVRGASAVGDLSGSPKLLAWFIATTPPALIVDAMLQTLKPTRAGISALLDKDAANWAWLAHASAIAGQAGMWDGFHSSIESVAQRLAALGKPTRAGTPDPTLAPGRRHLLESVSTIPFLTKPTEFVAAVERARPSADDALFVIEQLGLPSDLALEVLLATPDATAAHIKVIVFRNSLTIPKNEATLRGIRTRARDISFAALVSGSTITVPDVLASPELRAWLLTPAARADDLLWFCGSDPKNATEACRHVGATVGWAWTRELSLANDRQPLATLALTCPDRTVGNAIQTKVLGHLEAVETNIGAKAVDPAVYGGQQKRLDESARAGQPDVLERLADLDATERAALQHQPERLASIAGALDGAGWARAAVLIELSFRAVVEVTPNASRAIVTYLATRPEAEQVAVLREPALVARAKLVIDPDLFLVFPALVAKPQLLADALAANHGLLDWLVDHSDTRRLLSLLSAPAVRPVAERLIATSPQLLAKLPAFAELSPTRQADANALVHGAHGDGRAALDAYAAGEVEHVPTSVKQSNARVTTAEHETSLAPALASLLDKGTEGEIRSLLTTRRSEVPAFLATPASAKLLVRLAQAVELPPHILFPDFPIEGLFQQPNVRDWYYRLADGGTILRVVTSSDAIRDCVVRDLDGGRPQAKRWITNLPPAPMLSDQEDRGLDHLAFELTAPNALSEIFVARFGFTPPQYAAPFLEKLYKTLCRLPRGQLQQGRIKAMIEHEIQGGSGKWEDDFLILDPVLRHQKTDDKYYAHAGEDSDWKPRAEFARLWGLDDAKLDRWRDSGQVEVRMVEPGHEMVRMANREVDHFSTTVLHEVGHQVNEILGERTEVIYGICGWQEFADADFEQWADEMGGWNQVDKDDRPKFRDAWLDAKIAGVPLSSVAAPEHVSRSAKYKNKNIGIADAADKPTSMFDVNGRSFRAYGRFYSLTTEARETAPSYYALSNPGEYFSECYAEYYHAVDGTPAGNAKKGGRLPTRVKEWFDKNVDTMRYDPRRVLKPDAVSSAGPAVAPDKE